MRALLVISFLFSLFVSGFSQAASAQIAQIERDDVSQSIRPVIFQSERDGLLLGLDFRLLISTLEFGIGGAWGPVTGATRYRASFDYSQMISFSYGDWPESLVLGRQGENGERLSVDLVKFYRWLHNSSEDGLLDKILAGSSFQGTGFTGHLWPGPGEDAGPEVRYGYLSALIKWPVISGIDLDTTGNFLLGQSAKDPTHIFQIFTSSTKVSLDHLDLNLRVGSLENPAGLAGLQLNLGLRSYPRNFSGNRFMLATLERTFDLFSQRLFVIDLTGLLGSQLGWIPIDLQGDISFFMEGGVILNDEVKDKIDQIFFGWGTSLSFPDLRMRIDLAVNREGNPSLTIETGLLP
ncbi:hypothetical protein HY229_04865 [Candidatus Acetothermia bacterium]|nr:hypothetical protein [Candidatus Acetothermia bacterium]MBI3643418.1 hypothetical protein [Candidatus Acetothermia bacterium]